MNCLSASAVSYSDRCPQSSLYVVNIDGYERFVYHTASADFVTFSMGVSVNVEVTVSGAVSQAVVRPIAHGIEAEVNGSTIKFTLDRPLNLAVDIPGKVPLYLFGSTIETEAPEPDDPNVRYFEAGQVYDVGEITLQSNETIYIEEGAVVRGCVRSENASDIFVRGRGILDGGCYKPDTPRRSIFFNNCKRIVIRDIVMIQPSVWMIVLMNCAEAAIRNVHEIGEVIGSDGVDVVGSSHVLIEDCFFHNNDDCVVIKSFSDAGMLDEGRDVEDVFVRRCVMANQKGGNAMEIGHELRASSIRNITFLDCDVLSVHGQGAVFSIHNGDWATVSEITWEDIRVEHHYDKLIDIRVMRSRFNNPSRRGWIRNVNFKNITVTRTPFNDGYTTSLVGGYSAEHSIENITFNNLRIDGVQVLDPDQIDLFSKHADVLRFE